MTAPAPDAEPPPAFSRLDLGLQAAYPLDVGELDAHWRARPGVALWAATPFHRGALRLLVQLQSMESRRQVPSFRCLPATLSWHLDAARPYGFTLAAGPAFGSVLMVFQGERIAPGLRFESELCAGFDLVASRVLGGEHGLGSGCGIGSGPRAWRLSGELSALRVFTSRPVNLLMLRAGVARGFDLPAALGKPSR